MKKAQRTDLFREIIKSKNRFLSIFCIVALGVAFYAGVRSSEPDMQASADQFYDDTNFFDIRIVSPNGLTQEDVEMIKKTEGIKDIQGSYSADVMIQSKDKQSITTLITVSDEVNQLTVKEGRLPQKADECFMDEMFMDGNDYEIGDRITIVSGTDMAIENSMETDTYTIVGYGDYAQYLTWGRGSASIGDGKVDYFMGVLPESFRLPVYTSIYATVEGAKALNCYSDEYEDKVAIVKDRIEEHAKENQFPWYVLDRNSVETFVEYGMDANRIGAIGKVFPAIFFLVAALVSLTTMTRMVEEERIQIGTMKALGYGKWSIIAKYLWYALVASLVGSILGAIVGSKVLPGVILKSYGILYVNIPKNLTPFNMRLSLIAITMGVCTTVFATIAACYKELLASPAKLMRGTAPKQGKRVLLERVTFVWKRLSFTQKSTVRNLIRYKKRFFMTVLGIGGCMALIIVGFGLRDSIQQIVNNQYTTIWTYDAYLAIEENMQEDRTQLTNEIEQQGYVKEHLYTLVSSKEVEAGQKKRSVYLFVPETLEGIDDFVVLKNRVTDKRYHIQDDGVIITEKLSKLLDIGVGDEITLDMDETTKYQVKVTAIAENYMYHYVYMSKQYYEKLTGKQPNFNQLYLKLNNLSKEQVQECSNTLMKNPSIKSLTMVDELEDKVQDMMKSLDLVVWVLIISAGLLAFIVLYNLNNINIIERRRELATIKVLGFYDGELAGYVYRENVILTLVGIALGVILGIILHQFIIQTCEIDMIMFGRTIRGISYVYSSVITIIFAVLVNVSMLWKLKKIDMVESLKSVE